MSALEIAVRVALALVLLGGVGVGTASAVFTSSASGTGYTSLDDGANQDPILTTSSIDPVSGAESVSGAGNTALVNELYGVISSASINGSASVAPGQLRVAIRGLALIGPGAPNVPTNTHGTPRAVGSFGATFADQAQLSSNTLPSGTPVMYRVTWRMHADSNRPGHVGPTFAGHDTGSWYFNYYAGPSVGTNEFFPNGLFISIPARDHEIAYDVAGSVGETLSIGATLTLGADDRAGLYGDGSFSYGGLEETILDASNTVDIFVDPLTPDVTLVADSGHDYSITAPEAASPLAALLAIAQLGMIRRRRRRARGQ